MKSAPVPPAAELVADAISRIEARRNALDNLAAKGLDMAERLAAGEIVEIAYRKFSADPARAFAVVSRAVRLCLALASRLDEALIALLQGGPIPDLAILAPEAATASRAAAPAVAPIPASEPAVEAPEVAPCPRTRIARAVDAAIAAEAGDREEADRRRAYVEDHLIEGEDYDALLHQPWRVVVETICADLGLRPDWSAWDNAEGFAAAPSPSWGGTRRAERSPGWGSEGEDPTGADNPHVPTPLGQRPSRPSP